MKIKFLIASLIVFFSFQVNNLSAKILPPGTGTQADVPSNLLILLDKSGSMGWRMQSAQAMQYPYDTVTDSSGNIYVMQYYTYGVKKLNYADGKVDTSWGSNGVVGRSGSCRTYYPYGATVDNGIIYVASYYDHKIRKIRMSDGKCLGSISLQKYSYPRAIEIHDGHMYVATNKGLYSRNMSTGNNTYCAAPTGTWYNKYSYRNSYALAGSGNYLYSFYYYRLFRGTLTSANNGKNLCPTNVVNGFYNKFGYSAYGMSAHPSNANELYISARNNNKIYKVTVNANGTGGTINWSKGKYGYNKTSSVTQTYFYYPWGIHYDGDNDRIVVAGYSGKKIQVFDDNGDFLKQYGGAAAVTRMSAAHKAIKAIVTDSNLTSGVDIGFGYWSSSWSAKKWPPGFSSWSGNITTGTANPCDTQNCLKVRVHKGGAAQINKIISSVNARGGTDAYAFMKIAQDYYNNKTYSPIDSKSPCQKSYVIVIGDGDWYNHASAVKMAKSLKNKGVKTFAVAFGTGISSRGYKYFGEIAKAGGTEKAIIAKTAESLKTQLQAAISQIIASNLSFTAPAITATLNQDGSLYQASFDYAQNEEWTGTIKRTKIDKNGKIYPKDKDNWSARDKLQKPQNRKIWTVIPGGQDYRTAKWNNFVESNYSKLEDLFTLMGFDIQDYHRTSDNTDGTKNNKRCASKTGVADGTDDDLKGLINFIRGVDYFDYDGDCNITETRSKPMGDVYHSQLVTVGVPSAETAYTSTNQESYWRSHKGYIAWAKQLAKRKEVIYVGSNSGVLHALNAKSGEELWGFVPPFVASRLPRLMNTNLNTLSPPKGGSNAIYGVDGSPVQHDIYFESPHDTSKKWHTVLFIPYGRGGSGFSVLDVTDPDEPEHLVSIYNDLVNNKVYRMDHAGNVFFYDYIGTSYSLAELNEAIQAADNYAPDKGAEVASKQVCNDGGTSYCYKSKKWTLEVKSLTIKDIIVMEDAKDITNTVTITYDAGGNTEINFNKEMQFDADESKTSGSLNSPIGINIRAGSIGTGVTSHPEWDYSGMGETWSDPRMIRLPNYGAGDRNREDDISAAVMGGGFGTQFSGAGSNILVINLQHDKDFGKLEKVIQIEDTIESDIDNSVPASLTVITPDLARGADYAGALVYTSDLEGKITKVNLTNMSTGKGQPIKLYDSTTLFKAGATKTNGRYMYYAMDAAIGETTNDLWLYAGTGDAQRLNDRTKGMNNLMIGIKDPDYPEYAEVAIPKKADDISKCQNTTNDRKGSACRVQDKDRGWYITLTDFAKTTSQPKVNNGLVYFPVYRPSKSANKCDLGDALACTVDDECGTYDSYLGLETKRLEQKGTLCRFVGKGVLSEFVFFAGKLFANISGKSLQTISDLITLDAATGEVKTYRKSWKENLK